MIYKLAFVNACKECRPDGFKQEFWYKEELQDLFIKHDMEHLYETKIRPINNNRWYPQEVFRALEVI